MVGRDHCTVPTGRLDLGRKPNINIHTEKIVNNYGTGYGAGFMGMPYGGMYGAGYDCGYGNYQNYDNELSKGEKWMLALGGITSIGGAILGAFTGNNKVEDESKKAQVSGDTAQLTEQQQAQLADLQKQQETKRALLDQALAEKQKLVEESKLYQEGITKNDDGTYAATVKDIFGNNQKITASTPDEVRTAKKEAEAELKEQKEYCSEHGIKATENGDFAITVTLKDGTQHVCSGKTPQEAKQAGDDVLKLDSAEVPTNSDTLMS